MLAAENQQSRARRANYSTVRNILDFEDNNDDVVQRNSSRQECQEMLGIGEDDSNARLS